MRIVRITEWSPADLPDFAAHLRCITACEHCDGTGYTDGEAHLTALVRVPCANEDCIDGEVRSCFDGDEAERLHAEFTARVLPIGTCIRYGRHTGEIVAITEHPSYSAYRVRGANGNTHYVRSNLRGLEVAS